MPIIFVTLQYEITNVSLKKLRIMETLNERLTFAFDILIENGVFLGVDNRDAFCKCPDEQLQFVTNHLSKDDVRMMLSVCDLFSLTFGINYAPSISHNNLSVIFRDANHG